MAMRAVSIRWMSSASSSAPRAVKTRVSPTLRHRSCACVLSKTDGKSSGTQIVTGDFASALIYAASANAAWAAATPAPGSHLWPRSRNVSSSADRVGST